MISSLGGLRSAAAVLAGLPADFPVPILLLQHAARRNTPEVLARLLQNSTELRVDTARDGQVVGGPGVTVLPRGFTASLDAGYRIQLVPAVAGGGGDALLVSAAQIARARMIGVVLTGLQCDGALGVRAVKRHGGRVLAEDPRSAQAGSMPAQAIATGCVDFALPNNRLAAALLTLALAPGGAEMFAVPTPSWATLHA
jgi:two-component system chemotaxis response regulator CheB